ncbi:MAG: BadF/BadG/BcrA/BcrD ATPase family protein [Longimicrobiales bacterium]
MRGRLDGVLLDIWVGIDGGGTGTTAVALDDTGAVVARVKGGPALVDPLAPLRGVDALGDLARHVLDEAGISGTAAGLCCALAGAGRQAVRDALGSGLEARGVARRVSVIGDAEAALADAFRGGAGALLIAGTGSAAWARDVSGRRVRAGGWGLLLGDEGSGYAIGLAALREVVRAADGRAPRTELTQCILHAVHAKAPEDLIPWTAAAEKSAIAALAPLVIAVAAGDARADFIVEHAVVELAQQVQAVVERTMPWKDPINVAFAGGLIAPGRSLRDRTWNAVRSLAFDFQLREDPVDAARGAAHIARDGA